MCLDYSPVGRLDHLSFQVGQVRSFFRALNSSVALAVSSHVGLTLITRKVDLTNLSVYVFGVG